MPAEGRLDEGSDLLDSKEFAPCQSSEDGTGGREQSFPPAPHPSLRHAPQHSPGCGARLGARAGRFAVGTSRACGPPAAPISATRTSAPPTPCPHEGYAARVPFARWRRRPQGGVAPRAALAEAVLHDLAARRPAGRGEVLALKGSPCDLCAARCAAAIKVAKRRRGPREARARAPADEPDGVHRRGLGGWFCARRHARRRSPVPGIGAITHDARRASIAHDFRRANDGGGHLRIDPPASARGRCRLLRGAHRRRLSRIAHGIASRSRSAWLCWRCSLSVSQADARQRMAGSWGGRVW